MCLVFENLIVETEFAINLIQDNKMCIRDRKRGMYGWRQMNPMEGRKSVQRWAEYFEGQWRPVKQNSTEGRRYRKEREREIGNDKLKLVYGCSDIDPLTEYKVENVIQRKKNNRAPGQTSVSYTHLDVYKRQPVYLAVCVCVRER